MRHMLKHPLVKLVERCELVPRMGKITQFYGLVAESAGPDVYLGELCEIYSPSQPKPVEAEVVGFRDGKVLLMPYGSLHGIHIGGDVIATGRQPSINIDDSAIGHVIDAFGNFLDQAGRTTGKAIPLHPPAINPMTRGIIAKPFNTGIKAIDTFLTIGIGQRIGLMAGSGVGKSTLLGMITKNVTADINIIALIGERGREVVEFVSRELSKDSLKKTIIISATAEQHPLVRTRAAYAAHAIAEYFRDQGKTVFLAMDSATRFAMAQREIGLAIGEPPTTKGYTPSAFSALPRLIERAGLLSSGGSITAVYTVLVEADDLNDPVVDHLRAILDGHIILSRSLASQGHYPAIDIPSSISRLRDAIISKDEKNKVIDATRLISLYDSSKDMIDMGMYRSGQNQLLDRAIKLNGPLTNFLKQSSDLSVARDVSMMELSRIISG